MIAESQAREKGIAASSSVVAAVFLTSMKIVVGVLTGSLGILAEAAHSGLDLIAALITLFAIRMSDRPADESHPYGHGKVENLSALAETFLLVITCAWIIYEAINRLFFEFVEVDPSIWAFLIMGISIVVDYSRSRILGRAAKKYNSQALEADALHFSTDIWSSSVVILGLALVKFGELTGLKSIFTRADAIAALVVAIIVVFVSIQLGRRTVDALLDRAPHGLANVIADEAGKVRGVRKVSDVRARQVGNKSFVDMRVEVPRHLSFEESHAVTRNVQDAVRTVSPDADVVIDAVPVAANEGVLERIQAIAAQGHFAIHNITTHSSDRGIWIDLDLEVEPDLTLDRAHRFANDLEGRLRDEFTDQGAEVNSSRIADINVHIEPRAEELVKGTELAQEEKDRYTRRIREIQKELPHTFATQDIQLQRMKEEIYLSLHLILEADCPISQVHSIAEEMENRLRREFPQLGRVVIHAEPPKS